MHLALFFDLNVTIYHSIYAKYRFSKYEIPATKKEKRVEENILPEDVLSSSKRTDYESRFHSPAGISSEAVTVFKTNDQLKRPGIGDLC
jgi:hypothetical protein